MRKWLSGAAIVAVTGVGAYLVFASFAQKPPAPAPHAEAPTTDPSPAPAPPVVLADVVDVTDISPLLDPPTPPAEPAAPGPVITAVGMESQTRDAVQPASAAVPIPRAIEDEESDEEIEYAPDEPPVEVAPMPREVKQTPAAKGGTHFHSWAGPLLLDTDAIPAVPLRPLIPPDCTRYGGSDRRWPGEFPEAAIDTPLGPLFVLTDFELLRQRAEPPAWADERAIVIPPKEATVIIRPPASIWIPAPAQSDNSLGIIHCMYAFFHVARQAPASRVEWLVNWYGEARMPQQAGKLVSSKQLLDALLRCREANSQSWRYYYLEEFF